MPTPNVELLRQTLAHIKANPSEWSQDVYRMTAECGTAMCFAGWSATLAGGKWSGDADWSLHEDWSSGDYLVATDDDDPLHVADGVIHAAFRARRVLGLSDAQGDGLFYPNNSLRDLERLVAELCAGVTVQAAPAYPAPGSDIPGQPGFVVGTCQHRIAASEWRAGFRTCERCPNEGDVEPKDIGR